MSRQISVAELQQHSSSESLWIVVNDAVYDMTRFASEHPGGADGMFKTGSSGG